VTIRSKLLGGGAAVLLVAGGAAAQERLVFTGLVPDGGPHSRFYGDWVQRVNSASAGTLEVEIAFGATLANFGNVYERTMDDVVQIGWAQLALVGGRFPLTTVTDLPFMSDGGEACSTAAWRLYESGLVAGEFEGIVPLWFGCLGQNGLHLNQEPADPTALAGLQIRVASQLAGQAITAVGGTPVSMTVEQVYESLRRNTLQGAVTSWPAFGPQNLAEVTTHHLEVPLGSTLSMFFMSQARFDALPAEAQEALRANSGEAQSRAMGTFIAGLAGFSRGNIAQAANHTILDLSEAQLQAWSEALSPLRAAWIEATPGRDAVVAFYEAAHAAVVAGN
jgi:TRAP-type transport system periplasmic protein